MAFSFNPSSTPAFGAASTPAFNFGGASGAASTPSLFSGASSAAPSPFGGAVSTPAFSFGSSPSLFGATSAPAFGAPASTPAFGATTSAPSLFGAPAPMTTPSLFGAPQQPQQQQQVQLLTKDNRPISHSTKWDDLSPQAQQYLLELEKMISSCREECRQLDGEERLQKAAGARSGLEDTVNSLSQNVSALGVRVRADTEETEAVRESVMHLIRHTEAAVYAYKRTHAWREASRAAPGQQLPTHIVEQLGGPVALPSNFLVETISVLHERLKSHMAAAAELEMAIQKEGSRWAAPGTDANSAFSSLQASIANLHDCLMRVAAQLQVLDDKLSHAKAEKLTALHRDGDYSDPFENAEKMDYRSREMEEAAMKRKATPTTTQSPGMSMSPQQPTTGAPIPPGTGLFGTAQSPTMGFSPFGTPGNTGGKKTGRSGRR